MFGDRIRIRREQLGWSQDELAQRMGYSYRSAINKIETGKNGVPQSKIKKFAEVLGVSIPWLLELEETPASTAAPAPAANALPVPDVFSIPVLGSISCGEPVFADEDREMITSTFKADFCLRADGDSMKNAGILDGDLVFIRTQPEVENGEVAAVIVDDDQATLKRFFDYGDTVILRPENPAYKEQVYTGEALAHIRVLGKAIANLSPVR